MSSPHATRRMLAKNALQSRARTSEQTAGRTNTIRSGIIFKELRAYDPSDELKHVHWMSSARTGTLLVKTYEEEVLERFFILIDDRISMASGFTTSLFQRALDSAAYLLLLATNKKQSVGVGFLSGRGTFELPKAQTRASATRLIKKLYAPIDLIPDAESSNPNTGVIRSEASSKLSRLKNYNIFVLSNFTETASEPTQLLQSLSRGHNKIFPTFFDVATTLPEQNAAFEVLDPTIGRKRIFDFSSTAVRNGFVERQQHRFQILKNSVRTQSKQRNVSKMTWSIGTDDPAATFSGIVRK